MKAQYASEVVVCSRTEDGQSFKCLVEIQRLSFNGRQAVPFNPKYIHTLQFQTMLGKMMGKSNMRISLQT
jgi:hypothetical protein